MTMTQNMNQPETKNNAKTVSNLIFLVKSVGKAHHMIWKMLFGGQCPPYDVQMDT